MYGNNSESRLPFVLTSTLLTLMLGGWVISASLDHTVGHPKQTKELLHKSGLFQAIIPSQIADAQKSNPSLAGLPLDNPEIQKLLAMSLDSQKVQTEGDQAVDGIYSWMEGKTAKPKIALHISPDQQSLASGAGEYAAKKATTLPACAPGQANYKAFQADPVNATCLPTGITPEMVRTYVHDAIATNPALAVNTLLTEDDVKLANGKTIMESFDFAPKVYHWAKLLPLITAAGAVIVSLLLLLVLGPVRGIRSISKHFLSVGITLAVVAIGLAWALQKGMDYILPPSSNPNVGDALNKLTNLFDYALRDNIVIQSLYLVAGGLGLLLVAFALRLARRTTPNQKPRPATTRPSEPESLAGAAPVASFTPLTTKSAPKLPKSTKTAHKTHKASAKKRKLTIHKKKK